MNEIWKDIAGYEGLYQVSNLGRVKSLKKEIIMKVNPDKNGYLTLCLSVNRKESNKRIHRLVAEAFIPNPKNLPYVCHKDDNPENNSVDNLWWGTHTDNVRDMWKKDRAVIKRGSENSRSLITEDIARKVKLLRLQTGEGKVKISRKLGIPESVVAHIIRGNSWKHVKI